MSRSRRKKAMAVTQPRASITFPARLYRALEHLAKEKKVSLAWIVREAAERHVEDQEASKRGQKPE
jgi:predicted DNA-binding protein